MPRLFVVGSTNIDLTFRVGQLPRPGATVPGRALHMGHGGKGANQAVMAARLGSEVVFLSAVGDDDFGRQALANLRGHGVDTRFVRVCAQPTGTAAILVDDSAQNVIVVVAGANGALSVEDVRAARAAIESADTVVAQLETPIEATCEAFTIARARGIRTILNPAPVVPGVGKLLSLTDLCVPNETELEALTGLPARNEKEVEAALDALLSLGAKAVLVTLGSAGSVYRAQGQIERVGAFAVTAVDPTAAGDAYIGSLAVSLASGLSLCEAMHQASAAAALTVTRHGAQASFPSRQEVEAFLARQ
jgi:ribokinase